MGAMRGKHHCAAAEPDEKGLSGPFGVHRRHRFSNGPGAVI
jgi:hypothetical protein